MLLLNCKYLFIACYPAHMPIIFKLVCTNECIFHLLKLYCTIIVSFQDHLYTIFSLISLLLYLSSKFKNFLSTNTVPQPPPKFAIKLTCINLSPSLKFQKKIKIKKGDVAVCKYANEHIFL